jgi:hypothetical protein
MNYLPGEVVAGGMLKLLTLGVTRSIATRLAGLATKVVLAICPDDIAVSKPVHGAALGGSSSSPWLCSFENQQRR